MTVGRRWLAPLSLPFLQATSPIGIPKENAQKGQKTMIFLIFSAGRPPGRPDGRRGEPLQNGRGVIGKSILQFLAFGPYGSPYRKESGSLPNTVRYPNRPKPALQLFFNFLGPQHWSQCLRLALISNFPRRMHDLDAYPSSYCNLRCF